METQLIAEIAGIGLGAGLLGSMLGIGGGVFLVPLFSVVLGVPIHLAIGTSLVAVVATACAGASVYLSRGLTNLRLAVLLELPTVLGAIVGGLIAASLDQRILSLVFAAVAFYTSWNMARSGGAKQTSESRRGRGAARPNGTKHPSRLDLGGEFYDPAQNRVVHYTVNRLPLGMGMSVVGGLASGMLGIGGGVVKVPIMNLALRLPLKVATATSNFMVGITAVASAFVYYSEGFVKPLLAAPAALAVLVGASIGARFGSRVDNRKLSRVFAVVLAILALQMALRGVGWSGP